MKKYISLLLIAAMLLAFAGCGVPAEPTQPTEPETTAAPETTEATQPVIDTQEELQAALEASPNVELNASLELSKSIVFHAGTFDGNGYTLTAPTYVEDDVSTENGIAMQSGMLRNITIKGGYRCLGDTTQAPQMGDIGLENVSVDGSTYALNFGRGDFTYDLYAADSSFYGWSSYTGFAQALFENCTFGWDSTGDNGNLRPYVDTVLCGCKFEPKTEADGTVVPYGIVLRDTISGISITLEDCYVGDTLITSENIEELLNIDMFGNKLYVVNVEG